MTHPSNSPDIEPVYQLLTSYSFDAEAYQTEAVIAAWLEEFGPIWVSHAITEALYQGRYKLISIDQILRLWQRRGQPIRHFNREFESIILGQTLLCPTGYGNAAESLAPSTAAGSEVLTPATGSAGAESPASAPVSETATTEAITTEAPAPEEPLAGEPLDGASAAAVPAVPQRRAVPNFQPYVPDLSPAWPHGEVIQPFVPRQDGSELHERLRAVVQGGMRE